VSTQSLRGEAIWDDCSLKFDAALVGRAFAGDLGAPIVAPIAADTWRRRIRLNVFVESEWPTTSLGEFDRLREASFFCRFEP